jgi:RimJ/RimL family protein N-acetyltransferase
MYSPRLELSPLKASDADAMYPVLHDTRLHGYTGGEPLGLAQLRDRYKMLEAQVSPDGLEAWLNWILRLRHNGTTIGTVQASISERRASLAWVVGVAWQRQGLASEAVREVVRWLVEKGQRSFTANIHPENVASQIVARRAGLVLTEEMADGENVWRLDID